MSEIVGQGISRENLPGAYIRFIDRVCNDEGFREELAINPREFLINFGLSEEEMDSVKTSPGWQWLRDAWEGGANW